MSRELSTLQPTAQSSSKQLNTMMRRTQRSQVNAMVRLADHLVANIEQEGLTALIQVFRSFSRPMGRARILRSRRLRSRVPTGHCAIWPDGD
ncbi:hypothetical protein [Candidatus Amarolinea dominans]|uniref:hypothetical protein n=1 Tax=Candidatus Amarolinea dominans TaxID=3140696 RepID=UPI001D8D917A|nr:hypothetical protein [Anaerolineae bacterium]